MNPAEAFYPEPEWSPEERLWAAVLRRAAEDLICPIYTTSPVARARAKEEAQRWFKSRAEGIGSFFFTCRALDLDPHYFRTRLKDFLKGMAEESEPLTLTRSLRGFRLRNGLSQRDVAARIGVSHSTISGFESGYREISSQVRTRVEEFLSTGDLHGKAQPKEKGPEAQAPAI